MCTVSWLHSASGYELFCNRDERKTRPAAWPPRVRVLRGVKFIAPLDAQHGGSWLAVNQFGLALCLLNRYDAAPQPRPDGYISRGLLLTDLLDCADSSAVEKRLAKIPLRSFQPFTLAVLQPRAAVRLCQWNGAILQFEVAAQLPLTSSSFDTQNVIAQRQAYFAQLQAAAGGVNTALLRRFHHSHDPLAPAAAVCMHRADAQTVSFSHVSVTPQRVEFRYTAHAPCCVPAGDSYATSLDLVTT